MSTLLDPNFPVTPEGHTMHLSVGPGDVNPRILSVGDYGRGERISHLLESVTVIKSARGFATFSGTFEGTPVSVIVTGMGIPMMDFVVRESTHYITSQVYIIRLGTCGILKNSVKPGSIVVAESGRFLSQNYNYPESGEPYVLSRRIQSNPEVTESLLKNLRDILGTENVDSGVDITCETFYNAQGRISNRFDDFNENLVEMVLKTEPEAAAMEMETFKLLQLASCSKGKIGASACMIGLLNRKTQEMMDFSQLHFLEIEAAKAALKTLVGIRIE